MNKIRLSVVLDELLHSLRDSRACFETWAHKISDDELSLLFGDRARMLAQNEEEIAALVAAAGDATCGAEELQIHAGFAAGRRANDVIKAVGGCGLFSACEAEYCRALMRYRDTLDYVLPAEIYGVVARQFAELIDRHAGLSLAGNACAAGGDAEALALNT